MASLEILKKLALLNRPLRSLKADVEWYKLKQSEWRYGDMPVLLQEEDLVQRVQLAQSDFRVEATKLHQWLNEKATSKGLAAVDEQVRAQLLSLEAEFHALRLPKDL